MQIALTLQVQAPLALRSGSGTDYPKTLAYLPGGSLRGAMAGAHQQLRPTAVAEFADFFLRDAIRFGNAYPAGFAQRELQDDWSKAIKPLPATARSCKRWGGFSAQNDPDHTYHGVSDHLIPWALFAASGKEDVKPLEGVAICPMATCREALDALRGFYRRREDLIGKAGEEHVLYTRTGISRRRGTAEEGILYSREALAQGTRLWAGLQVDGALFESFRDFVEEAGSEGLLRAGTSRSRGMGRLAVLNVTELAAPVAPPAAVGQRVAQFNAALAEAAKDAAIPLPHRIYVPITLVSDLLLLDSLLRHQTRFDGEVLAQAGIPDGTQVYCAAVVRRVYGWNALLGLPRATATGIAMGSVFLFGFQDDPDYAKLAGLEVDGLGSRRGEGFGVLSIADSFHWEVKGA